MTIEKKPWEPPTPITRSLISAMNRRAWELRELAYHQYLAEMAQAVRQGTLSAEQVSLWMPASEKTKEDA